MLACSGGTEVYYARKQVALELQCLHVRECACECVLCCVRVHVSVFCALCESACECVLCVVYQMVSIRRYWASSIMQF